MRSGSSSKCLIARLGEVLENDLWQAKADTFRRGTFMLIRKTQSTANRKDGVAQMKVLEVPHFTSLGSLGIQPYLDLS